MPELFVAQGLAGAPPTRRKFSLDQIRVLAEALGNPHQKFPSVLIAGTNGKGSTASTLASIAQAAGLRVGLYTSPHLERVNERIRINGDEIADEAFAELYFKVHDTAQQLVLDGHLPSFPSYFELLTALAFLAFAEAKVDIAVLEVGMGGRLDATNLVEPLFSVITDISLDHQEWLGDTISAITREKAGILRLNGTLVTLPQHPEANQTLGEVAAELNVRGVSAAEFMPQLHASAIEPYEVEVLGQTITIDSPLKGAHQHRNIALAITSAVELAERHGFPITPAAIAEGIRNTHWPARLEIIRVPGAPEFLLDVAHNPAGAWALRAALNDSRDASDGSTSKQCLVFSCLRDKPLREMTQILFPIFDHVVLAPIHSPRASEMDDLVKAAAATGIPFTPATTIDEAIALAKAQDPSRIVISGSLYLVGEARTLLLQAKAKAE